MAPQHPWRPLGALLAISVLLSAPATATPLSGRCSEACYAVATCQEELGRCDCPKHLAGVDCARNATPSRMAAFGRDPAREAADPMPCLNHCVGRGTCVLGTCICHRGYFGSDCSLSLDAATGRPQLLAGTGYVPRRKRPLVYVYDIPHKYSSWHHPFKVDRVLMWALWERLLGAGVLTADGDGADWYFIPAKMRTATDGYLMLEALAYVRKHWPWYDRLQGHRHFVIHSGDMGRGEVTPHVQAATANVTWLHHLGLTQDCNISGWKAAHRRHQDIVVPIYLSGRVTHTLPAMSPLHPRALRLPRNGTLLFAGRICGDKSEPDVARGWPHCATNRSSGYSQGARQLVHLHHSQRPGFKIVTRDKDYVIDMMTYKWCLAPSGGGHGHRQTLATVMGCLPVVVSDHVLQPFEPHMDWAAFALRVPMEHVPRLHELLDAVEKEQQGQQQGQQGRVVQEEKSQQGQHGQGQQGQAGGRYDAMQAAARCAAQHLTYSTMAGAFMQEDGRYDAFEFILETLRMQQQHPGLDPAEYVNVDEQYRAFVYCGEADMAAYGRKLQDDHARKYGGKPLSYDGTPGKITLQEVLEKRLEPLFKMHRAQTADGTGNVNASGLCSLSFWDPDARRCATRAPQHIDSVGRWYVAGGAACAGHGGEQQLARCPRVWP